MYKCLMHHKYSISLKLPKSTQHWFDQITVLLCPQITIQKFVDIQYRELTEKHLSIMDCIVFHRTIHVLTCKMNRPTGKDYWLYSSIFYMCRSMGILPLVKSSHINPPLLISEPNKGIVTVKDLKILPYLEHNSLFTHK